MIKMIRGKRYLLEYNRHVVWNVTEDFEAPTIWSNREAYISCGIGSGTDVYKVIMILP